MYPLEVEDLYTLKVVDSYNNIGYFIGISNEKSDIVFFENGVIIDIFPKFFQNPERLVRFFALISGRHVKIDKNIVDYFVDYFENFMNNCTKRLPNLKKPGSTLYKSIMKQSIMKLANENIKNKIKQKKRDLLCFHLHNKMEIFIENLGVQIFHDIYPYVRNNFGFSLPNNQIKYLIGPNFFSEFSINTGMENEKNIAIFGETHLPIDSFEYQYIVPNLDRKKLFYKFLRDIVTENPDKEFDIFLEIDYTKKLKRDSFSGSDIFYGSVPIKTINMEFSSCFDVSKRCKFSNTRGHYGDYRSLPEFYNKIEKLENLINSKELLDREEFEYISKKLLKLTKNFSENKKFLKNSSVQEFIYEQYQTNLVPLLIFSNDPFENKKNLKKFLFSLSSLFMDYYVLSRIMKKESNYQKNIIIYTGSNHSKRYYNFFNNLVGSELRNMYDNSEQTKLALASENKNDNMIIYDHEILRTNKSVWSPLIDIMKLDTENSFLFNKNKIL